MIHDAAAAAIDQIPESTDAAADSHCVTDADVVEALQEGIREAAREEEALINHGEASLYYDSLTMSPLNAMSTVRLQRHQTPSVAMLTCYFKAALARFRAYKPPPFPLWDRLPARRRAAVLILLYADRRGDLRVVITMRAASLRSFSGHAAFPGGKADDTDETPCEMVPSLSCGNSTLT